MMLVSRGTFVRSSLLGLCIGFAVAGVAQTGGALSNGISARATSLGGATVASVTSPLEAMQGNPAGLTELSGRSVDVSGDILFVNGSFDSSVSNGGKVNRFGGALPYAAFALPLRSGRLKFGFSVTPETMMTANWIYLDPPGGLGGTSYGMQRDKSVLLAMRSAGGLAYALTPKLSIGGTVGLIYNRNTLDAPYIFQQQPQLAGAKTILNLHTSGAGVDGSFGVLYSASSKFKIGAAYKSMSWVHSYGDANGNVDAQFATLGVNSRPDFHYDAEVDNKFPQAFSGGVSWQVHPRARLNLQAQWIGWSNAFKSLPVKLTDGNNSTLNGIVGSSSLNDAVPLDWHNQVVFGVGVESPVGEFLTVRGGYSYSTDPVPSATLTPLTAAILQNTVATGVGYTRGHCSIDLAYQAQLQATGRVGQSSLLSGEYSNSRVQVGVQSVTLTTRFRF
jgi:long-chain fatty acid transport protein